MPPRKKNTAAAPGADNESKQSSALSFIVEDKDWRNCIAKMVIYEDLISGTIPLEAGDMRQRKVLGFTGMNQLSRE